MDPTIKEYFDGIEQYLRDNSDYHLTFDHLVEKNYVVFRAMTSDNIYASFKIENQPGDNYHIPLAAKRALLHIEQCRKNKNDESERQQRAQRPDA